MKKPFVLQLPARGSQLPSFRNFILQYATVEGLADALQVSVSLAHSYLISPKTIWQERRDKLDRYFSAEPGTFSAMIDAQVTYDRIQARHSRPISPLVPYREKLFCSQVKTFRDVFPLRVPLKHMAIILGISQRRAHYLCQHPEQIDAHQLIALGNAFSVNPDFLGDLTYNQYCKGVQRHRPKWVCLRYWCKRKPRRSH